MHKEQPTVSQPIFNVIGPTLHQRPMCTTLRHRRADGRPTTSQHDANLAANVGPIITTTKAQRSTNVAVLMGLALPSPLQNPLKNYMRTLTFEQ